MEGAPECLLAGESTNAPERIKELLKLHFPKPDISMFDVRYQLLYATVGTLAARAEVSVLYVVVFKTPLYNETTSAENDREYVDIMAKVKAERIKLASRECLGHKLALQGKELICLYEHFELGTQ